MATASKTKGSGADKGPVRNPKTATSSVANKNTLAARASSGGSTKGGTKSATAKTGGANKSSAAKSSGASKTGASKTTTTAKKADSKGKAAKASTASDRGGSKTSTGTKSGAAGKRTASGGAKQSAGRSNSGGSTKSKSATGSSAKSASSSRATGKRTAAKAGASKSADGASGPKGKKASSGSKNGGNGIIARATDAIGNLFAATRPNAISLLKADHETVNRYFDEVKGAEDANHQETYKKIKFELDAHAHIEETIFYPYLMDKGDKELQKIVLEGIEEHRQAKLFLAELGELHGDNDRFKAKLKVLMEDVEHHVDEEENEMFPMVEEQVPREKLESMGLQMEKEKARFQKMMSGGTETTKRASARG